MDHPRNVNHPTHWMTRGYGLFAANSFGSADFTQGEETLNFTLEFNMATAFVYRVLFHSGKDSLTHEQLEEQYHQFLVSNPE